MFQLIPKGVLFSMLKKKFSKKAGFKVDRAEVTINYKENKFEIKLLGENKEITDGGAVNDFSDMSDMLTLKIKEKLKSKSIDYVLMKIFLDEKRTEADVYFVSENNESLHENLNELF